MTYVSVGHLTPQIFHLPQAARHAVQVAVLLTLAVVSPLARAAEQPWLLWQKFDPQNTSAVDHTAWQQFLDEFVVLGADGITRVSYQQARATDWPGLRQYLTAMAAIDPRTLNKDEAMAYWINLYNALTVDVVLRHPGKASIKQMGKGLFSFGPWDDEVFTVAGTGLTLNDIEHRILRPIWRDHRIHYAVNCASIGCPNLSQTVFSGADLERQLTEAEVQYLSHPRGLRFTANGRLQLSSIFDWYRDDFGDDRQALLTYLSQHHDAGERVRSYGGRIRYEYDWQLNSSD